MDNPRDLLAEALEANGLSTDPDDWRDSQGLGQRILAILAARTADLYSPLGARISGLGDVVRGNTNPHLVPGSSELCKAPLPHDHDTHSTVPTGTCDTCGGKDRISCIRLGHRGPPAP